MRASAFRKLIEGAQVAQLRRQIARDVETIRRDSGRAAQDEDDRSRATPGHFTLFERFVVPHSRVVLWLVLAIAGVFAFATAHAAEAPKLIKHGDPRFSWGDFTTQPFVDYKLNCNGKNIVRLPKTLSPRAWQSPRGTFTPGVVYTCVVEASSTLTPPEVTNTATFVIEIPKAPTLEMLP